MFLEEVSREDWGGGGGRGNSVLGRLRGAYPWMETGGKPTSIKLHIPAKGEGKT